MRGKSTAEHGSHGVMKCGQGSWTSKKAVSLQPWMTSALAFSTLGCHGSNL
jgi:hypothetical protein